jgi:hypothetical protein
MRAAHLVRPVLLVSVTALIAAAVGVGVAAAAPVIRAGCIPPASHVADGRAALVCGTCHQLTVITQPPVQDPAAPPTQDPTCTPDPDDEDSGLLEAYLAFGADRRKVFAGGTVVLQGQLTGETPELQAPDEDADDPDDADDPGDGECDTACAAGLGASAMRATCEEQQDDEAADDGSDQDADDESDGDSDQPIVGATVSIFMRGEPEDSLVATVTTADDGSVSLPITVAEAGSYYAVFDGNDTHDATDSDPVRIKVFALVSVPSSPDASLVADRPFALRGRATNGAGDVTITVLRGNRGNRVARRVTVHVRHGRYAASLRLPAGTYRAQARQAGGGGVGATTTAPHALKVGRRH